MAGVIAHSIRLTRARSCRLKSDDKPPLWDEEGKGRLFRYNTTVINYEKMYFQLVITLRFL